jgi:hypothetical protein
MYQITVLKDRSIQSLCQIRDVQVMNIGIAKTLEKKNSKLFGAPLLFIFNLVLKK